MSFRCRGCLKACKLIVLIEVDQPRGLGNKNGLTALSTVLFKKLNGAAFESPSCRCIPLKLIVLPSSRAGVPVCKRPNLNPADFKDKDNPIAGLSPSLPAGKRFNPKKNQDQDLPTHNEEFEYRYGSRPIEMFQCR